MKELYEKVYIKSEADLPKEDGYYFACLNNKNGHVAGYQTAYQYFSNPYCRNMFLENIDWYLQPITESQPEDELMDEEIEKEFISFGNYFHKWKLKIKEGCCPKRPDEIYKLWATHYIWDYNRINKNK